MLHKLIKFFSRKSQENNSKEIDQIKETTLQINISLSKVTVDVISSGDEGVDKREHTGIIMAILAMPNAISENLAVDFLKRYPDMSSIIDRLVIKDEPVVRASEVWSNFKIK